MVTARNSGGVRVGFDVPTYYKRWRDGAERSCIRRERANNNGTRAVVGLSRTLNRRARSDDGTVLTNRAFRLRVRILNVRAGCAAGP